MFTPKRAEAVNQVHKLVLEKKFDEADTFIQEHKKVLFGRLKKGAALPTPFELQDEHGETVLMKAIKEGDRELVTDLIDNGAPLDVSDRVYFSSFLIVIYFKFIGWRNTSHGCC